LEILEYLRVDAVKTNGLANSVALVQMISQNLDAFVDTPIQSNDFGDLTTKAEDDAPGGLANRRWSALEPISERRQLLFQLAERATGENQGVTKRTIGLARNLERQVCYR
jgi:hypothetical protein